MPGRRWRGKTAWAAAAGVGILLYCVLGGCGRKLPPIQPGALPAPAVADLAGEASAGEVRLVWSIPPARPAAESEAAGFKVLRARRPVDESECATCPVAFQVIGDVAAAGRRPGSRLKFRDSIQPGFQHRYKIQAYSADGRTGRESNTVVVD